MCIRDSGKPIHYKGYGDVLAGKKQFSEIMGSSKLQSLIVMYIILRLGKFLDFTKYRLLSSELGLHLDTGNNLAGDVLVFDMERMPIDDIDEHYADVPPKVIVEVDIAADPTDMDPAAYLFIKTQKLLDFGVERVIWITTKARKVTVATADTNWQTLDWDADVEIMDGITINIGEYLTSEGSTFA